MSRSLSKTMLIGHVGRNPDVSTTRGGKLVANFSLATNYKAGGAEKTEWHRIRAWDKLAEIVQNYVAQGDRLYIEGRIEYGSFEKNGVSIPTVDIVAREIIMLSANRTGDGHMGDDE